mgnify:FL=1
MLLVLCIPLSTKSQSYIKSIEHGVYIDHQLTYPYTQVGVTTTHGLYFELGMLDLPTKININFNNTIQQRAGRFSWMINNVEEPVGYKGTPRWKEFYYSIGYSSQIKWYRGIVQYGYSYNNYMIRISQYARVIKSEPGYLDLGIHLQWSEHRQFLFFGYSWGFDLN